MDVRFGCPDPLQESEVLKLKEEILADPTLKLYIYLGDRQEMWYSWTEGMLYYHNEG